VRPINLAKLNHVLIPSTKAGRDRFRQGRLGRTLAPVAVVFGGLSDEGRAVALLAVLVGAFALDVRHTDTYMLWCVLVALTIASLVARGAYGLGGVQIEVVAPPRVMVGEAMRFAILLRNDTTRDHRAIRVRRPYLPWDGSWTTGAPRVRRLAAGTSARVELDCRFVERGEHHLDSFEVAQLVPFGLAMGRPITTTGSHFLVVPRLARVDRLTLPAARRHQPGGMPLASKTGESMELLGLRPYRPGDPVRHLHARSWARHGLPVVREYQEEYFSRIGVILDTDLGRAEDRGAKDPARLLEGAISLAAGIVAHLSRGEALIDLLVVGDRVHELTLGRSLGSLEQALDLLACVEPGPQVDDDALVRRLAPHLSRLSCVVVVSLAADDGALAERVRGHGVSCAVVAVGLASATHGRDARTIAVDGIERGEALSL
jgi:uncharacterized protein (DUF58 family)